jgi:hypothetical protein
METKNLSDDKLVESHVGFAKTLRVGDKVITLLMKKTHDVSEAYDVVRFLCVYFEVVYGCRLISPSDAELRAFVKEMLKG